MTTLTTITDNNVNLSQYMTNGVNGGGQAAIIDDNVYIGLYVCVMKNVHIGNNATLGTRSVATIDITENATTFDNYVKALTITMLASQ